METKELRLQPETPSRPGSGPESLPLADAIERLSIDLKQLAQREAALAKHEIGESLTAAKQQAAALALGGTSLLAGVLVLLAAAVLALALVMPAWLAALSVGVVVTGAGGALILSGKAKLSKLRFTPERTVENVARDVSSIKRAAT